MTALTDAILVIGIALIRAELGAGADELFASLERTPLAAASIAQVYASPI